MKAKHKKTKRVKVVDEMPKFKRTTRIGVNTARVEKKKMHTSTKPIVKKEKPKSINGNLMRKLKSTINKIERTHSVLNNSYEKLEKAAERFRNNNTKETARSLRININNVIKYCNILLDEINEATDAACNVSYDCSKKSERFGDLLPVVGIDKNEENS